MLKNLNFLSGSQDDCKFKPLYKENINTRSEYELQHNIPKDTKW